MIEQLLDLTNYTTDTRVASRKTCKKTNEFFIPYSIFKRMCDRDKMIDIIYSKLVK